jgi:hypothetical protein
MFTPDGEVPRIVSYINGEPQTLYNIGVGPLPHNEAHEFKKLFPELNVKGLEPQYGVFVERYKDYCGDIFPWGIWSEQSIKKMHLVHSLGESSILPKKKTWSWGRTKRLRNTGTTYISCITLDQFDELMGFPEDIFLWMDIEGAELEAFKGADRLLSSGRLKWVDCEVDDAKRRKNSPLWSDITSILNKYNYKLLKCHDDAGREVESLDNERPDKIFKTRRINHLYQLDQ